MYSKKCRGKQEKMQLSFIKAQEKDIGRIFDLSKEQIDIYEDVKRINYEKTLEWIYNKIKTNISEYVCVLLDGDLVGYYYFHKSNEKMEIDDLYVLPEHRQKGIGTTVIEKCCLETKESIFLYVFEKNSRAISLYQRLGFEIKKKMENGICIMQRDYIIT